MKRTLLIALVLVFLFSACASKTNSQAPASQVPAVTATNTALQTPTTQKMVIDAVTLTGSLVDLISYETNLNNYSVTILMQIEGNLISANVNFFHFLPVSTIYGTTGLDEVRISSFGTSMPYRFMQNSDNGPKTGDFPADFIGTFYASRNSDGAVEAYLVEQFQPTDRDQQIEKLASAYLENRVNKARLIGAMALENKDTYFDPMFNGDFIWVSTFVNNYDYLSFVQTKIPDLLCQTLLHSFHEWGMTQSQFFSVYQLCSDSNEIDVYSIESLETIYTGTVHYYVYNGFMWPDAVKHTPIDSYVLCPGRHADLADGSSITPKAIANWVDVWGGFSFTNNGMLLGIPGEGDIFVPYGGYLLIVTQFNQNRFYSACTK